MASKITELSALTSVTVATTDVLPIVDVSDSSNKKITVADLLTNATLSGTVALLDAATLAFGTGTDVTIQWDATNLIITAAADDSLIEIADSAATQKSFDLKWYANENNGASYLYADASANLIYTVGVDLQFKDDDFLVFGTGGGATGDVQLEWDTTGTDALRMTCTADDTLWEIGDGTNSFDVTLYGNTTALYISWDASGADLKFEDSVSLMFGTGAAAGQGTAGDVEIRWDGTDLDILGAADDLVINFGNGTNSFDVKVFGNTASDFLLWDASANSLTPSGAATIRPYVAIADPGNAGAIPITVAGYCPIVTAGAETRTLAAPTYIGQELLLYMKTDLGDAVITCATTFDEVGNNTITFSATGQAVKLFAVEEGGNLRWRCPVADPVTVISTV